VIVLADDLPGARQWTQALARDDLRFICDRPSKHERLAGAWSTFDLVVLHVGHERANGILPRQILHEHQRCLVVLRRPASGAERAWWIDQGADDCVSEPCDEQEVLARLRASLRRQRPLACPRSLSVGPLMLWPRARAATLAGRPLALTTCEFSLLVILAEHAGEVLGREALLEFAKGSAELAFERSIDVQISRLRAKLGDDPRQPRLLKTVRGLGYVLVAEPPSPAHAR
jgi:DNA-binding response OmpR family regulator